MMKISLPLLVLCSTLSYAQVGINNTDPKATLDITAKTTDASQPEGLIAPRLTGDEIKGKNAQYDIAQTGAIIYATSADSSPAGKTANITASGYYYFDGTAWQKINTGISGGSGTNIYTNDGTLQSNRTVAMADKTLNFNSTATTGTSHFNVDGSTLNVNAVDNRVGIGTSSPVAKLDIVSSNNPGQIGIAISNSSLTPSTDRGYITVTGSGAIDRIMRFTSPGSSSIRAFEFIGYDSAASASRELVTIYNTGQMGINTGPTLDVSAQLDVKSSDKGFLPPRLALSATNNKSPLTAASPNPGVLVYNTATTNTNPLYDVSPGYYYWDGSKWGQLLSSTSNQAVMDLVDCSSIQKIGISLVKGKPAVGQITLSVNVTKAGKWSLITNSVNGVYFTGGGEFYYTGTQTITLNAQGTATATASPATFNITVGATTCSVNQNIFDVSTYTMKVLSLTPDDWNMNINSGSSATDLKSKLTNTANFGSSGVVQVQGLSFEDFNISGSTSISLAAKLEEVNILWIGWVNNGQLDAGELNAITNWVKEKKGIAIFHADDESHNAWITSLGYSSNNYGSATGFTGKGTALPLSGSFGNLDNAGFSIGSGTNRGAVSGPGIIQMIDTDDGNIPRMIVKDNYVIISDIDLARNEVISNGTTFTNNNDKLYGNVFEWAVKNAPLK